jgi:hypothetical protein
LIVRCGESCGAALGAILSFSRLRAKSLQIEAICALTF